MTRDEAMQRIYSVWGEAHDYAVMAPDLAYLLLAVERETAERVRRETIASAITAVESAAPAPGSSDMTRARCLAALRALLADWPKEGT